MSTINRDDWLAALATVEPETDENALTIHELVALFGTKHTTTKHRIRKLVENGTAVVTRKRIIDSDGRSQAVVAYRLVTAPAKRKAR